MKRLLCLISAMNAGGAETFLMKLYRKMDRTRYQMDFCVNIQEEGLYDSEIISMGGRVFHIPAKTTNLRVFSKQLYRIIKDNGYKYVMRITSNAIGFYDLYIAKKAGAVKCIARSSNSSDGDSQAAKAAHFFGRLLYQKYVDVEIAPSDLAAIYTFGKKDYQTGKVQILHNGIDYREYCYSDNGRKIIRSEFGIAEDCFVVGHVGRFSAQKNHAFLLEVFAQVYKVCPNAVLLLVGEGELEDAIRKRSSDYGLEKKVVFAGVRRDIPNLLSAMDVFVFPSIYEGMPNVIIEAQATNLPCLISDTITKQAAITENVVYASLSDTPSNWASIALILPKNTRMRQCLSLSQQEYDIDICTSRFTEMVFGDG